jgi:hypothetical protein
LQVTPITGKRSAELTDDELLAMVLRLKPTPIELESIPGALKRESPAIEAE